MGSVVGHHLGCEIEEEAKSQPWILCRFGVNQINILSGSIFMFPQEDTKGAIGGVEEATHEGGNKTALINSWSPPFRRLVTVLVDIIHDESQRMREK